MKTTTLTLTEQELNDLREFYTMQLARARREAAHYENILNKLEKGQKPIEQAAEPEVTTAPVKVKGKRGRPRKEMPAPEKPIVDTAAEAPSEPKTPVEEVKPKGKKGRPRKMKQAPELLPPDEMPMAKKAKKTIDQPIAEGSEPATEQPKAKKGRAPKATEKKAPRSKAPKDKIKKPKASKTNAKGRKTLTSDLDIPYTEFILATLAKASMALRAKDLISIMKEEYKLEDKVLLKKAEASLRSSLSGLKKKGKVSFLESDEGVEKYYLAQPINNEAEEQSKVENTPAE